MDNGKDNGLHIDFVWRTDKFMIAIDRKDCYDKTWKCPILVPAPKTEGEYNKLMDKIKWLQTEKGYKASNEYEFDKWMNETTDKEKRQKKW